MYEVLVAWENWTGPSKDFYRSLGFSQWQMASIIGKAKKLKRDGYYGEGEFKPVTVQVPKDLPQGASIEIVLGTGQIVRFPPSMKVSIFSTNGSIGEGDGRNGIGDVLGNSSRGVKYPIIPNLVILYPRAAGSPEMEVPRGKELPIEQQPG